MKSAPSAARGEPSRVPATVGRPAPGTEERSGMGSKVMTPQGLPAASAARAFGEQCLVAAMYAVEIADGDRCATERGRNRGGGVEDVQVHTQRKVSM